MSEMSLVVQHKELIARLLGGQKDLRHELTLFMTSMGDVWAKLPVELHHQDRLRLLGGITEKFMEELFYRSSALDELIYHMLTNQQDVRLSSLGYEMKELQDKKSADEEEIKTLIEKSSSLEEENKALRETSSRMEEDKKSLTANISAVIELARSHNKGLFGGTDNLPQIIKILHECLSEP